MPLKQQHYAWVWGMPGHPWGTDEEHRPSASLPVAEVLSNFTWSRDGGYLGVACSQVSMCSMTCYVLSFPFRSARPARLACSGCGPSLAVTCTLSS